MSNLIKIKDISTRYDITARTLRYYEDMGLITSTRADDYAYRLYDEAAVIRLEQILILRKLNISIKDIQRIFNTTGSGVVLDILNKKIQNIDDEVALLHELKDIVLDFIREVERIDFSNDSNIKLLYDKAKEIEIHMTNVDYIGKPSNVTRLIEITDKLDKQIPDVMVVRLPKFKALSSGYYTFADGELWGTMGWADEHKHLVKPVILDCHDFLTRGIGESKGKFNFVVAITDDATEADATPYEITVFPGGLYAMLVSIDSDNDSIMKVEDKVFKWLENTNFEYDDSRDIMGHMGYTDDEINKGLGYAQLQRYIPIKLKKELL